jgi:RNA polymerase sigma-70 factor, ECF subfamily
MMAVTQTESLPLPVAEARAGDPNAWDALYQRFQLPLFVYVQHLVQHETNALDIVQETFINAARYIHQLKADDKLGSWLFGIAHQKCLQHWRKRSPDLPFNDQPPEELADESPTPDAWLVRKEQENQFLQCLDRLPPDYRTALLLFFLEEFSLDEIAEICGAPVGTIKSRLHHAKRMLRHMLEE